MRDKIINLIRSVPIADKTYPEYVEALADKMIDAGCEIFDSDALLNVMKDIIAGGISRDDI